MTKIEIMVPIKNKIFTNIELTFSLIHTQKQSLGKIKVYDAISPKVLQK